MDDEERREWIAIGLHRKCLGGTLDVVGGVGLELLISSVEFTRPFSPG
jgi:hypothetical protein